MRHLVTPPATTRAAHFDESLATGPSSDLVATDRHGADGEPRRPRDRRDPSVTNRFGLRASPQARQAFVHRLGFPRALRVWPGVPQSPLAISHVALSSKGSRRATRARRSVQQKRSSKNPGGLAQATRRWSSRGINWMGEVRYEAAILPQSSWPGTASPMRNSNCRAATALCATAAAAEGTDRQFETSCWCSCFRTGGSRISPSRGDVLSPAVRAAAPRRRPGR